MVSGFDWSSGFREDLCKWWSHTCTLKDFKNAKTMKLIKFTNSCVSILLKFGDNNYHYVSKICSKFHIKIMSNKKVTA